MSFMRTHQPHTQTTYIEGRIRYRYVHPSDGAFGTQQEDGTWSGMVGMVSRKEADFSIFPFTLSARRSEVVDFTSPVFIDYLRILGARGQAELHPWGFLFPFEPEVWVALLTALVLMPIAMYLLASCYFVRSASQYSWTTDTFTLLRVLLQQDMSVFVSRRWWKRLVYTGWMLMVLVLSKGYASNLMSNLAVRHRDQPFQTLRDVLDAPGIKMIWLSNSAFIQYFRSAESGIFHEVAEAERTGRITYQRLVDLQNSANTLVRRGDHVLVEMELFLSLIVGRSYSRTGRCDFYSSKERFLPTVASLIGQKNSHLVPALSKRIMSLTEAGLYNHWFGLRIPNSTSCVHPPLKITESATLSLAHLTGIFIVLLAGHTLSFHVLWLEILTKRLTSVGFLPSDSVHN
ncbi:probable glutamate receptor [Panulirus ornatus]|uniref:probable glutamate receptor n=1 Tax=Panulirus ornatus TaxID=150431 RepID=UPI003A874DD0